MRFPAVVEEAGRRGGAARARTRSTSCGCWPTSRARVQYTLKGRYEQDVVLREVLEDDPELRALHEHIRSLPEDASYYDRVKLGELVVAALEQRREVDAAELYERLEGAGGRRRAAPACATRGRHRRGVPGRPDRGRGLRGGRRGPRRGMGGPDPVQAARPAGPYDFVCPRQPRQGVMGL